MVAVAGGRHREGAPDRAKGIEGTEYFRDLSRRVDPEHPGAKSVDHRVTLDGTTETELDGFANDRRKLAHTFTLAKSVDSFVYL